MQPFETIHVDTKTVACDGGTLGHPRVYLKMKTDQIQCPYCSRLYLYDAHGAALDPHPTDERLIAPGAPGTSTHSSGTHSSGTHSSGTHSSGTHS